MVFSPEDIAQGICRNCPCRINGWVKENRMIQPSPTAKPPKGKAWHHRSADEVLEELGSTATGLPATEAAQRLAANGPNQLQEGKRISTLEIFFGQFKSIIIWILIAAVVLSGVMGEVVDAIAMLITLGLNMYLQKDFAREWSRSLEVKHPEPLGEDEIARMLDEKNRSAGMER